MKSLVIVESPTKARTIGRYLGDDYLIKASMGHVMDLPKSKLGVDIEHDFKPEYQLMSDKKKVIDELKQSAKEADKIILATDLDREGEAIASHVAQILRNEDIKKLREKKEKSSIFQSLNYSITRIVFHEITKKAIEEALENPRSIDVNLVDAQTARRVLDRLVGYKLSPLLWKKIRRGLSAGRVQSVALRLIVEREREIEKFKKEEYWTVKANFVRAEVTHKNFLGSQTETINNSQKGIVRNATSENFMGFPHSVEFDLIEISGEKLETQQNFNLYDGEYRVTKTIIDNEKKAKEIENDLKTKKHTVAEVESKNVFRSPQPPYTTSTLQQDGARRLGFSGRRTMSVAQKLYEEGFITYHRTDSVNLSQSAVSAMRTFIKKDLGEKYLPDSPRFYKTKQKLAQEAHEAIRPTTVGQISNLKSQISNLAGNGGWKLYELIWRRAVACQVKDAEIELTTVIVDSQNNNKQLTSNKYRLKTNGSVLVFDGFLKINPQALQDKKLPDFKVSEFLIAHSILAEKKETPPPPRYNDASLIATLEEKGIGRPSTYANIVSTIEVRRYIERQEGRFIPTPIGVAVNDFLVEHFSTIDDIPFTAEMENNLDSIANGKKDWVPMIREFYTPFSQKLKEVENANRVKIEVEETDELCGQCGSKLVIRLGRFGKFLSCSQFPKCKFSKPLIEETGLTCPKCGGKIILKKTRKGRKFYGCSNYPKCDFAAWKLEEIHL